MVRPPVTFTTDRLVLSVPVPGDALEIYETYASDPEVTRYLSWLPHRSLQDTAEFLAIATFSWDQGDAFAWTIRGKESRSLLGMIEARVTGTRIEIGYVLAKRYWGQGYMTEAVSAITRWALRQSTIFRVWAVCDLENTGSARVLEKAGMIREGILRRWLLLPNRSSVPRDCYCYAKVRE